MSSAANEERGNLEQAFRHRMYDAEAEPSQQLWDRIDHQLTVQENGAYKKRVLFYRQLAAACVALLLLVGGASAYYFGDMPGTTPTMATVEPIAITQTPQNTGTPAQLAPAPPTLGGGKATKQLAAAANPILPSEKNPLNLTAVATTGHRKAQAMPSAAPPVTVTEVTAPATQIGAIQEVEAPQPEAQVQAMLAQSSVPGFAEQSAAAMALTRQQEDARREAMLAEAGKQTTATKTDLDQQKRKGRWSLGMAYAPGYFEQNVSASNAGMAHASRQSFGASAAATSLSALYMDEAREEYEEYAAPGFSQGFEVKTGVQLWEKLKLLAGIGFLQNTARSKSSYVLQPQPNSGISSIGAPAQRGGATVFTPTISAAGPDSHTMIAKAPEYEVNYRYRHLTVPVGLQYEGGLSRDWFWYGGASVAANILLQATVLASSDNVQNVTYEHNDDSPFRKVQWSGNVSAGVGRRLASNVSVTLGPEARGYFSTMLADPEATAASQSRPYTVGMQMAVNYDLRGKR